MMPRDIRTEAAANLAIVATLQARAPQVGAHALKPAPIRARASVKPVGMLAMVRALFRP